MKPKYSISIFLIVLVVVIAGIIIVTSTIPVDTNTDLDLIMKKQSPELHDIPIHVYEIWNSNGVIIHGMIGNSETDSPVTIKITNDQDDLIEAIQVTPDKNGRFVHGIVKTNSILQNVSSYTVTAQYATPVHMNNKDVLETIHLDKNTVPLSTKQTSQMSHEQIISTIKEWNKVGGDSPFTIVSVIGIKENYALGEPMPFFVQKSGYGNPCHDQGVVIFNEDTQIRAATGFYLEACTLEEEEEKVSEPYNYLIPYNQDIFAKLAPIMEHGNYVLIAGADDNSKYKKRFTVSNSDYIFDYNVTYQLQKDSKDNTQSMTIDLNSGKIAIIDTSGAVRESSIDQDTFHRINAEIIENGLIVNPWSSHKLGDDCDTCNFGIMKIMIDDVVVHLLIFDETTLTSQGPPVKIRAESPYFFSIVDCIASKNGFDTFWISDSEALHGNGYEECNTIGGNRDKNITPKYGKNDYDDWVNDKPKLGTPPNAGPLGVTHEHASILVKIFGDKLDFSQSAYQIKSAYIHFEGRDGNTIHVHSTGVLLGFLFESMGIGITDKCFVFADGREFCTNEDYSLKYYVNEQRVDSVNDHVISQDDKILISYGPDNQEDQIIREIAELQSQILIE